MVEDELFQGSALENYGILVKAAHFSGELDAVEQVHGHVLLAVERGIEKSLLDIRRKHGCLPIQAGAAGQLW